MICQFRTKLHATVNNSFGVFHCDHFGTKCTEENHDLLSTSSKPLPVCNGCPARIDAAINTMAAARTVVRPTTAFAPCSRLGDVLHSDKCEICGSAAGPKGKMVEVRACSIFGECSSAKYRQIRQPQVCNMACSGFREKLVQITG